MILHRKLCVQTNRSRNLHYTQVPCHVLRPDTLQMVSEHYVACRIETLGLDRNRLTIGLKIYFYSLLYTKICSFYLPRTLIYYQPSENTLSYSRWPCSYSLSLILLLHMEKLQCNIKFYMHERPLKNQDATNTSKIFKKVEQELEAPTKEVDFTTT